MPRQSQRSRKTESAPRKRAVILGEPIMPAEVMPWEVELLRPLFEAAIPRGEARHDG